MYEILMVLFPKSKVLKSLAVRSDFGDTINKMLSTFFNV